MVLTRVPNRVPLATLLVFDVIEHLKRTVMKHIIEPDPSTYFKVIDNYINKMTTEGLTRQALRIVRYAYKAYEEGDKTIKEENTSEEEIIALQREMLAALYKDSNGEIESSLSKDMKRFSSQLSDALKSDVGLLNAINSRLGQIDGNSFQLYIDENESAAILRQRNSQNSADAGEWRTSTNFQPEGIRENQEYPLKQYDLISQALLHILDETIRVRLNGNKSVVNEKEIIEITNLLQLLEPIYVETGDKKMLDHINRTILRSLIHEELTP